MTKKESSGSMGMGTGGQDSPKHTEAEGSSEKLLPENERELTMPLPSASADAVDICPRIFKSLGIVLTLTVILLWFHLRLSAIERSVLEQSEKLVEFGVMARFMEEPTFQEFKLSAATATEGEFASGSNNSDSDETRGKRTKRKVDQQSTSGKSRQQQQQSTSSGGTQNRKSGSEAHVEFIMHPRLREEMDAGGGARKEGGAGAESESGPVGPDGAWLTAYSRIPVAEMQEFCSRVKDNCPPGVAGPPGTNGVNGKPGPKGDRGDPGPRGERGGHGHPGPHGQPGVRGPKGEPGSDGHDGFPGEPGLDGIPGRNGLDGVPGMEGLRGRDGTHGIPGRNGTDGIPGQQGMQGPPGNPGARGLPGIAGQRGAAGTPGRDGTPGVQAWIFQNETDRGILIPPAIIGSTGEMRPLVVNEEENVRLSCTATGTPTPTVTWRRKDGGAIRIGAWKADSIQGPVLNFTRINRQHMGEYICMVGNGLTPSAQRSYHVEVKFPPLIHVQNQQVSVVLESTATLQCDVEAFPEAITYWESSDEKLLTSSDKYKITSYSFGSYKVLMTLNITKVSKSDLNFYYCVSKNILGIVKGRLSLSELDPNQAAPSPNSVAPHGTGATYGKKPPKFEDFTDNCPPMPPPCKECPARIEPSKCTVGGYFLLDKFLWEIEKLGRFLLPSAADRPPLGECVLSAVGKPVYHGNRSFEGNWMQETYIPGLKAEKYYLTIAGDEGASMNLQEFEDKNALSDNRPTRNHPLHQGFKGNYHTIYNGSFYYIAQPEPTDSDKGLTIFRKSLTKDGNSAQYKLPHSSSDADPLYSPFTGRIAKSWVDLAVDENGLWAIYSLKGSNNTAVVKIDLDENENMNVTYGWNITISHKHAGDMFIICGVLYAVDSVTERVTKIRMALDLYKHSLIGLELSFTNPFLNTIMISYNPKTKELFTWDGGNQLIYPVKRAGFSSDYPPGNKGQGRHLLTQEQFPNSGGGGPELNHAGLGWRKQSRNGQST